MFTGDCEVEKYLWTIKGCNGIIFKMYSILHTNRNLLFLVFHLILYSLKGQLQSKNRHSTQRPTRKIQHTHKS